MYEDEPANAETYGNLYNWYTVDDARGVCPEGWHAPSDEEWSVLTSYLGSEPGGKLKEAGYDHWNYPNVGATNETGFTAIPGGTRNYYSGDYRIMGNTGIFWSSTAYNNDIAWTLSLYWDSSDTYRMSLNKPYGLSLRCIMD